MGAAHGEGRGVPVIARILTDACPLSCLDSQDGECW